MKEELTLRTAETEEEYDRLRTASPSTPHEELSPRAVEAEEECDRLRDELQTTKLELEKMKQTLLCAQRVANQWRNAARKASTALERAAKDISFATDELDVVEEVFEQI
jgi:chromosome segregation ATPase